MLLWLAHYLSQYYHGFQVFHYLTLRALLSSLTALLIALSLGPMLIRWLTECRVGQVVREDGPQSHLKKTGTPTMGGLLILIAITFSVLLWGDWKNHYLWVLLLVLLSFGGLGAVDDYWKLRAQNTRGVSARGKLFFQLIFALLASTWLYWHASTPQETALLVPFFKSVAWPLGILFIPFACLVIVGTSNAVNLTDGLDGLAIMPIVLVAGALGIFAYVMGHGPFAEYLSLPHLPGAGEAVVVCAATVGAGLGFLWFNSYPAQVFMGDIGSLGLGALLGLLAVIVRQELVLLIMGGVFVMETLSVIIQVASFKLTGKRVFRMAPIHHHFELKGWPEPKIIVRFWIITVVLVLCGLATLKLR